jgi:hypothetical protein
MVWLAQLFEKVFLLDACCPYYDPRLTYTTTAEGRIHGSLINPGWKNGFIFEQIYDNKSPIFVAYENADITLLEQHPKINNLDIDLNILLIRDPYNLAASLKKSGLKPHDEQHPKTLRGNREFVHLWTSYAREALGETDLMSPKMTILYNQWFASADYRQQVVEELNKITGLNLEQSERSDKYLKRVAHWGGGSSFDKKKFENKAQEMAVLERYHHLKPEDFIRLEPTEELCKTLFPEIYEAIKKPSSP